MLGALKHRGFYPTRQKGSHIIVENGFGLWTTLPRKDEIGKGLLLAIIKDWFDKAGIFKVVVSISKS